jgi:hypothetical protein
LRNEPIEDCDIATNETTLDPLSVVSGPLSVAGGKAEGIAKAIATNEPTDARENAPNEPTDRSPSSVPSALAEVSYDVGGLGSANLNEPTDREENAPNEVGQSS